MKLHTETTPRRHTLATAAAAALAALALVACGEEPSTPTAAQTPEPSVTEQTAEAAREAGERITEGAAELRQEAGQAIGEATGVVSDAAITAAINAELVRDSELSPMDIDVDTVGGRVALTGKVPSDAAKERAGTIAGRIDGVVAVDNQLSVSTS